MLRGVESVPAAVAAERVSQLIGVLVSTPIDHVFHTAWRQTG